MRKFPFILAVLGLAAVTLTSCSTPSFSTQCERAASATELGELVTVSGEAGVEPTVSAFSPLRTNELKLYDVEMGSGPAIVSPEQLVLADVVLYSGETGERIIGTAYNGDPTRISSIAGWAAQELHGIGAAQECAREGARIIALLGPEDIGPVARQGLRLGEQENVIAVIDVHKIHLTRAEGRVVLNTERGVPAVVTAPDGRPGVIIPVADPPTELITQVLIEGAGQVITGEHSFRAHYSGFTWVQRKQFQTSWDGEPPSFTLEGVVPGVAEALEGQRVGSRVLIVVPPELGYGDQVLGSIPANSTLVFIFDILGLETLPER